MLAPPGRTEPHVSISREEMRMTDRATHRLWRFAVIRRRLGTFVLYAVLIGLSVVFLVPLVWALTSSLKTLDNVYQFPPSFGVADPQWSNYPRALSRLPFARFILNTLVFCLANVVGGVFTASLVGFGFARLHWRGRDFWFIVVLATMMLPGQVLLIPHFLIYKSLGWVNSYKPLIVPAWLGGGAFAIFLFRQFFKGIPVELEEAARLDGASSFQIYWRIMLPLARPAVITIAVISFMGHWQEFMGPLIYLSDFETYPISLGLRMYQTLEGSWANYLMAASLVATAPLIVLFFAAQRYLVRGLLIGGTKG
jgi:ABC-type glycerol-3-phosphate transport system permease component